MKILLALSLLLTTPVFATWDEPEAVDVNQVAISASESLAVSHAASLSSSSSRNSNQVIGGTQTLNAGDLINYEGDLTLNPSQMANAYSVDLPVAPLGSVTVGDITVPLMGVTGSVLYNDHTGFVVGASFSYAPFAKKYEGLLSEQNIRIKAAEARQVKLDESQLLVDQATIDNLNRLPLRPVVYGGGS